MVSQSLAFKMAPDRTPGGGGGLPSRELMSKESLPVSGRDLAKLREMGITDYAIVTYIDRVRQGESRERALRALLQGRRSLTAEEKQFVRAIMEKLHIPPVDDRA